MKVVVKDIKVGSMVTEDDVTAKFTADMSKYVGKAIEVEQWKGRWFTGFDQESYRFHASWFDFDVDKIKGADDYKITSGTLQPKPIPDQLYCNPYKRTVTVLWRDGSKTVVTCNEEEFALYANKDGSFLLDKFKEDGFKSALARKTYGHYKNYKKYVNRMIVQVQKDKTQKTDKKLVKKSK